MTGAHRILVVESDSDNAAFIKNVLDDDEHAVINVKKVSDAMPILLSEHIDLIISDLKLTGQTGLDLLRKVRAELLECPVIIMTSYTSIKCVAQALRLGAADIILKPFSDSYLIHAVSRSLNERSIKKENIRLKQNLKEVLGNQNSLIGQSLSVIELKELIKQVGPSEATVLIQGESGTGKELVARAIHNSSERKEGRFVPVNCGAIPSELMESEFFGHAKGAFTGSVSNKEGLIKEAHRGTLFLDEIAELAPMLQVKLLRFLQDKIVRPVGDTKEFMADVRVIAACNRDLRDEVAQGRMREDLFYRLNVIQISVPPLRQREGDIEILLNYFIENFNKKLSKKISGVTPGLLYLLKSYDWPGNVRELENSVERAMILAKNCKLSEEDFKHVQNNKIQYDGIKTKPLSFLEDEKPMSMEEYAKQVVITHQHEYTEQELAQILGIGRKALWMRRNRWGIPRDRKMNQQ